MSDLAHTHEAITAAHVFRDILAAMSRPGQRITLRTAGEAAGPLQAGTLALIRTLCEYQTPVFLSPRLAAPEAIQRIRFETGAPTTDMAGDAAFAAVTAGDLLSLIGAFTLGTHEYPDRSATVIVQLDERPEGAGVEFSGPGVGAPRPVALTGMGSDFWAARDAINAGYPLGLDFIFVMGRDILACPRTTKTRILEKA